MKYLSLGFLFLVISQSLFAAPSDPFSEKSVGSIAIQLLKSNADVGPQENGGQAMPEAALELLARHPRWETIPYMQIPVAGSYQVFTEKNKKWATTIRGNVAVALSEITALSLIARPNEQDKFDWGSVSVDLTKPISIGDFYIPFSIPPSDWQVVRLRGDKFVLRSSDGSINVIFIPALADADGAMFLIGKNYPNAYALTTPLGFIADAYDHEPSFPKLRATHYYHHANTDHKTVVVEPNFPKKFYPAIIDSLAKWNRTLGRDLFQLAFETRNFDPAECLSENMICFYWSGEPDVAWTGMTAITAVSFDPESGQGIGGLVSFFNQASANLKPAPLDVINTYLKGQFDLSWIAEINLQKSIFASYESPEPLKFVEYFLVHEIGHYVGLRHNFMGSKEGTAERPTKSIMDYLPFPAVMRANDVEEYDRTVLDLVYRKAPYPAGLPYCGDYDHSDQNGIAGCDQRDIGDSISWYGLVAKVSPQRLMTPYSSGGPNDDPNKVLVDELLKFKIDPDKDRAQKLICSYLDKETNSYLNGKNIILNCDGKTKNRLSPILGTASALQ